MPLKANMGINSRPEFETVANRAAVVHSWVDSHADVQDGHGHRNIKMARNSVGRGEISRAVRAQFYTTGWNVKQVV